MLIKQLCNVWKQRASTFLILCVLVLLMRAMVVWVFVDVGMNHGVTWRGKDGGPSRARAIIAVERVENRATKNHYVL